MVKVTVDLTKVELEMLMHCIDTAIDVKHIKDINRLQEIKDQFSKYI